MKSSRKYVIIAPCRNESEFLSKTIDSVVKQSILPSLFLIVNDGSTDDTAELLKVYEKRYDFIQVVHKENRGYRNVGPGVIEAFYYGFEKIDPNKFDYICKLDLDLILPDQYFEKLIGRMEQNHRIGTCSGKPYYYNPKTNALVSEHCGDENAIGASKFYRRTCFTQIGGFVRQVMWDGIDGHRCRMLGWIACSWDEPELRFVHLRPMGSSQKNLISGRIRHGYGQYFMGATLSYTTAVAIYRTIQRPLFVGAAAMWWGFVKSAIKKEIRYDDLSFRRFLRKYQRSCLIRGKRRTIERINKQQERVWCTTSH